MLFFFVFADTFQATRSLHKHSCVVYVFMLCYTIARIHVTCRCWVLNIRVWLSMRRHIVLPYNPICTYKQHVVCYIESNDTVLHYGLRIKWIKYDTSVFLWSRPLNVTVINTKYMTANMNKHIINRQNATEPNEWNLLKWEEHSFYSIWNLFHIFIHLWKTSEMRT